MNTHGALCSCLSCITVHGRDAKTIAFITWPDPNQPTMKEEVMSDNATGATKALKRALKARKVFPEGTVIRWVSAGRYMYVAVFVNDQWYTTSANGYIAKVMDTETLTQTLARNDVSDIEVAASWNAVSN